MIAKIDYWTDCVPLGLSVDFYRDIALAHCRKGGTMGKEVAAFIKRGDFASICAFEVNYAAEGMTPMQFYHTRQALAFFTKLELLDIGVDKEKAAIDKFMEAEELCRKTNETFRAWARGELRFDPVVDRVLSDATRHIARVLGNVPPLKKLGLRFGPGATTLTRKRDASARRKLRDGLACSDELLPILNEVMAELAAWTDSMPFEGARTMGLNAPLVVGGNVTIFSDVDYEFIELEADVRSAEVHCRGSHRVQLMDEELSFALKNAKTHRTVSKPPPLNSLVQLGYGDEMSKRLSRHGLDLSDQSLNQRLAKEGSLTGALATLDLSSASDTIATELVYHLLPVDWANALSQCRCKFVTYRGERLRLEKFSSMGNGYTFPLESLIFWALAKASCDAGDTVSVYGDDIIIPSAHVPVLEKVLGACGFVVNRSKSFSTGPFRESCGADWYRGFNIRPYYAKKLVSGESLFSLHNYYARSGQQEFCELVLNLIPEHLKTFGPDGFGDGHLLGTFEKVSRATNTRSGYGGFYFRAHKHVGIPEGLPPDPTDMCHALYSVYRRSVEKHSKLGLLDEGFSRLGLNYRNHKFLTQSGCAPLSIAFSKDDRYRDTKAVLLPGTNGSKVVLIYTLG